MALVFKNLETPCLEIPWLEILWLEILWLETPGARFLAAQPASTFEVQVGLALNREPLRRSLRMCCALGAGIAQVIARTCVTCLLPLCISSITSDDCTSACESCDDQWRIDSKVNSQPAGFRCSVPGIARAREDELCACIECVATVG